MHSYSAKEVVEHEADHHHSMMRVKDFLNALDKFVCRYRNP